MKYITAHDIQKFTGRMFRSQHDAPKVKSGNLYFWQCELRRQKQKYICYQTSTYEKYTPTDWLKLNPASTNLAIECVTE